MHVLENAGTLITNRGINLTDYNCEKDIVICQAERYAEISLSDIPERIGNHYLHLAVAESNNKLQTWSRWSEQFCKWWLIQHTGHARKMDAPRTHEGNVLYAIYARPHNQEDDSQIIRCAIRPLQQAACAIHSKTEERHFIIKVPRSLAVRCCHYKASNNDQCGKTAFWRCDAGINLGHLTCKAGICNQCLQSLPMQPITSIPQPTFSTADNTGAGNPRDRMEIDETFPQPGLDTLPSPAPLLRNTQTGTNDQAQRQLRLSAIHLLDLDEEENHTLTPSLHDIIFTDDILLSETVDQTHCRATKELVYDPNTDIPSKFLFTNYFKILKRNMATFESANTTLLLQQLVTPGKKPVTSLMFPEGNIFPSIFFGSRNGSVLGALPHHMYYRPLGKPTQGIADLRAHNYVRLTDGDLATAHNFDALHWIFDFELSDKLNHNSSQLLVRRGFEHLTDKGTIGFEPTQTGLDYDDFDSAKKIKELAALMKSSPWNLFYTVTPNDQGKYSYLFNIAIQHCK